MTAINAEREANIALATKIMSDFGRNMEGWYDNLHDDIVLEFPFGASVGMPTRIEGRAAAGGRSSPRLSLPCRCNFTM